MIELTSNEQWCSMASMKKHRLTTKQAKLLKRIERVARHAALDRLHGRIQAAMQEERKLDILFQHADDERLGGAGALREERGQHAAYNLAKKTGTTSRSTRRNRT
jgi:hypothetical protein